MSNRRKSKCIKVCTWNAETMAKAGKMDNAIQEMNRMNINIMGISEMRWRGAGSIDKEEHHVFYSDSQDGKMEHGVGMIVTRQINRCVTNIIPLSDREICYYSK